MGLASIENWGYNGINSTSNMQAIITTIKAWGIAEYINPYIA